MPFALLQVPISHMNQVQMRPPGPQKLDPLLSRRSFTHQRADHSEGKDFQIVKTSTLFRRIPRPDQQMLNPHHNQIHLIVGQGHVQLLSSLR
jgi:hypothetical protein